MTKKEIENRAARAIAVEAAFPKRLDAEAIRKIVEAVDAAGDEGARQDAKCAMDMLKEKVVCLAGNHANYVLTPRMLAKARRMEGDAAAAAGDYDCLCPVPDEDCIPLCEERRPSCRFAPCVKERSRYFNENRRTWEECHAICRDVSLSEVSISRPEELAAALLKMEKELAKANDRRRRVFGAGFPCVDNSWIA